MSFTDRQEFKRSNDRKLQTTGEEYTTFATSGASQGGYIQMWPLTTAEAASKLGVSGGGNITLTYSRAHGANANTGSDDHQGWTHVFL